MSGDAEGVIKTWDVRKMAELTTTSTGPNNKPVNSVSFDPSGAVLAVTTDTGKVSYGLAPPFANCWSLLSPQLESVQKLTTAWPRCKSAFEHTSTCQSRPVLLQTLGPVCTNTK